MFHERGWDHNTRNKETGERRQGHVENEGTVDLGAHEALDGEHLTSTATCNRCRFAHDLVVHASASRFKDTKNAEHLYI